ncbi:hypothetical protein R8Z50_19725 [Longispora sp. K20-0274]|uniref:hypothetical protein n=1 Tax=Longispora sp. K20-0274 TaxID=3088255 RepID=UPI00399A601E
MIRRTLLAVALAAGALFAASTPAQAIPTPTCQWNCFDRVLYYDGYQHTNLVGVHIPGPWCGNNPTYDWGVTTRYVVLEHVSC